MSIQCSPDEILHTFPNGEQEYIKDNHLGRWYINTKTSRLEAEAKLVVKLTKPWYGFW